MNSQFTKRSSLPLKRPTCAPRSCFKQTRRLLISLQFSHRQSQALVLLISLILLLALSFIFHISLRSYFPSFLTWSSQPHLPFSGHDVHTDPLSAFSESVCTKKYDPAWTVMQPDDHLHHQQQLAAQISSVQIAYFIQVGNDSVPLLPRLIKRIHRPQHIYLIHLDAKIPKHLRDTIVNLVATTSSYTNNIHIMESEMVTYKAMSMVTNTISAMTLALEKHKTWHYFINLSGADYPLVSPDVQASILARPRSPIGRLNFVSFFPKKEWLPYSFRIRKMYWDPALTGFQNLKSRLFMLRSQKINPLEEHRAFVFTKAEAWMILSRPFVQFIIRSSFAKRMLLNHMHALSVPEHYFSDVLYNHPVWRKTIVPHAFRTVVWYLGRRRSGQHPYVLDGGDSPYQFWPSLQDAKSFFARKFNNSNSLIMDRIDVQIGGVSKNETAPQAHNFEDLQLAFSKRITDHFDELTKSTLSHQGFSWPRTAYPKS